MRRRLRQLQRRPQVADAAARRVHLAEQRRELRRRQLFGQAAPAPSGSAAVDDPLPDARERDAHQPAAALAARARERHADAEGHQVAADVVDRRNRQELRLAVLAEALRDAAHRLHDAVEAAPPAPRAALAPRGERDADDARPQRGERLGREAARGERAGAVGLREDVASAPACAGVHDLRRAQVEARGALADAGVELDQARVGQVRGADLQHVGAVLGEAARAGRAGEHARQVEHADAGERPRRRRRGSGGASPMRTISMSGCRATACACGCAPTPAPLRT